MEKKTNRRRTVRTVTFLAAAFAVSLIFAVTGWVQVKALRRSSEYADQRAMEALSESVDGIEITLKKTLYAGSANQFSSLAAKLWSDCAEAKSELGQLPANVGELDSVNKFISQVGNYAVSLSKKRRLDEDLSSEERETLEKLRQYASKLRLSVDELIARYSDCGVWFGQTEEAIDSEKKELNAEQKSSTLSVMSEEFTDYPALIYDGPFSDHIYDREPRSLKDEKKVTKEQALKAAMELSDDEAMTYSSSVGGNMPMYVFRTDETEVGVTVQGGKGAYMLNSRQIDDGRLSVKEAVRRAENYVNARYADMKKTYYEISGGRCIVNFALTKDGVTVYPDLIKVAVSLDNGEVIGVDARDYLMNHTEREIGKPAHSEKEASRIVSRELKIESSSLALIPTDGKAEKLCWEFLCSDDDQKVLVYVNTSTLEEENIFLLMEDENGRLTI